MQSHLAIEDRTRVVAIGQTHLQETFREPAEWLRQARRLSRFLEHLTLAILPAPLKSTRLLWRVSFVITITARLARWFGVNESDSLAANSSSLKNPSLTFPYRRAFTIKVTSQRLSSD